MEVYGIGWQVERLKTLIMIKKIKLKKNIY